MVSAQDLESVQEHGFSKAPRALKATKTLKVSKVFKPSDKPKMPMAFNLANVFRISIKTNAVKVFRVVKS